MGLGLSMKNFKTVDKNEYFRKVVLLHDSFFYISIMSFSVSTLSCQFECLRLQEYYSEGILNGVNLLKTLCCWLKCILQHPH